MIKLNKYAPKQIVTIHTWNQMCTVETINTAVIIEANTSGKYLNNILLIRRKALGISSK